MKKLFICICFLLSSLRIVSVQLLPYDDKRDRAAVLDMLFAEYEDFYVCTCCELFSLEAFLGLDVIRSDNYTTMVCRDGDQTVGFITYTHFDKKLFPFRILQREYCLYDEGHVGLIFAPLFYEDYYHKELHEMLVSYAVKDIRKHQVNTITLLNIIYNQEMHSFFESLGFRLAAQDALGAEYRAGDEPSWLSSSWWNGLPPA